MRIEYHTTRTLLLAQRHRWKLVGENNRIVAASSEGFYTAQGARDNAILTMKGLIFTLGWADPDFR